MRRNHPRGEFEVLGRSACVVGDPARGYDQLPVLHRERIVAERRVLLDAGKASEVGIDVDLLLAVLRQRIGAVSPPLVAGAPCSSRPREAVETFEVVRKRLHHCVRIDGQRKIGRRECTGLAVAEGERRTVAEIEDGVGAHLMQSRLDVGEVCERKARQADRVALRESLEIGDDVGPLALPHYEYVTVAAAGQDVVSISSVEQVGSVVAGDHVRQIVAQCRGSGCPGERQVFHIGRVGQRIAVLAIGGDRIDAGCRIFDDPVGVVPHEIRIVAVAADERHTRRAGRKLVVRFGAGEGFAFRVGRRPIGRAAGPRQRPVKRDILGAERIEANVAQCQRFAARQGDDRIRTRLDRCGSHGREIRKAIALETKHIAASPGQEIGYPVGPFSLARHEGVGGGPAGHHIVAGCTVDHVFVGRSAKIFGCCRTNDKCHGIFSFHSLRWLLAGDVNPVRYTSSW